MFMVLLRTQEFIELAMFIIKHTWVLKWALAIVLEIKELIIKLTMLLNKKRNLKLKKFSLKENPPR